MYTKPEVPRDPIKEAIDNEIASIHFKDEVRKCRADKKYKEQAQPSESERSGSSENFYPRNKVVLLIWGLGELRRFLIVLGMIGVALGLVDPELFQNALGLAGSIF